MASLLLIHVLFLILILPITALSNSYGRVDRLFLVNMSLTGRALDRLDGQICFVENGDEDCITAEHIAKLLQEFPQYSIRGWHFLPASQYYVITITRVA
jgi:hypothetical protein